jgi:hypothetical protein
VDPQFWKVLVFVLLLCYMKIHVSDVVLQHTSDHDTALMNLPRGVVAGIELLLFCSSHVTISPCIPAEQPEPNQCNLMHSQDDAPSQHTMPLW